MIASIWVINTQSRGPRGRRVPELMRQCILRGLRRLVCLGDDAYFPLNEIDTLSMKSLDIPAVEPIVKSDISGNQSKLEKDVEEILRHVQTMIIVQKLRRRERKCKTSGKRWQLSLTECCVFFLGPHSFYTRLFYLFDCSNGDVKILNSSMLHILIHHVIYSVGTEDYLLKTIKTAK